MAVEEIVLKELSQHWFLLVAAWWVWTRYKEEKKERVADDAKRREAEKEEREEAAEATREVVRDELASHTKEEMELFQRFRDEVRSELAGIGELVRQHDARLARIEARVEADR